MKSDEKDLKKLSFLIDKIVKDANIVDGIQHRTVLDAVDLLRKEVQRVLFLERINHE